MGWLEFWEKIVGHVVTLLTAFSWPIVAGVLFFTQRVAIAELMGRVRGVSVGKDGVKVDAELRANTEAVAEAKKAEASNPPVSESAVPPLTSLDSELEAERPEPPQYQVPSTNVDELIAASQHLNGYFKDMGASYAQAAEYMKTKPSVVIERAWKEVETVLYRVVMREEQRPFTYLTGNDLLRMAIDGGLLDTKLLEAISGLLSIHNETVTGIMGWEPTREQAAQFVENAGEVLTLLKRYLSGGKPLSSLASLGAKP